jgi:hypothetical protein
LAEVLEGVKAVMTTTDQCCFSNKPYGKRWQKKFKLAATGTWVYRLSKNCKCPGGVHEPLMITNDNGSVSGTKQLKLSQAYPPKFGESVIAAWAAGELKDEHEISIRCKKRKAADEEVSGAGAASWQVGGPKKAKAPAAKAPAAKGKGKAKAKVAPAGADWTVPRK